MVFGLTVSWSQVTRGLFTFKWEHLSVRGVSQAGLDKLEPRASDGTGMVVLWESS